MHKNGSMNICTFRGNLGSDPEMRNVGPNNTRNAKFSIAMTESEPRAGGEYVDVTTWVRIECWGKVAEQAEKFLKKGYPVGVIGSLRTPTWEKNGQTVQGSPQITVRQMENLIIDFAASRQGEGGQQNNSPAPQQSSTPPTNQGGNSGSDFPSDDEIPF